MGSKKRKGRGEQSDQEGERGYSQGIVYIMTSSRTWQPLPSAKKKYCELRGYTRSYLKMLERWVGYESSSSSHLALARFM